jgi:glycosyltransferase involved in cell wall biosynthesis
VMVSSRCGCAEDLVEDGANGFLFDPAVSGQLTERMMTITSLPTSDRERMGRRSYEIVSRFSPDGWAEQVVQISSAA